MKLQDLFVWNFFFFWIFIFPNFYSKSYLSLFFFSLVTEIRMYDSMTYGNSYVKYSAGLLLRFTISAFNFTIRRFVCGSRIISICCSSKRKLFENNKMIPLIRCITDFISDLQFKEKRD